MHMQLNFPTVECTAIVITTSFFNFKLKKCRNHQCFHVLKLKKLSISFIRIIFFVWLKKNCKSFAALILKHSSNFETIRILSRTWSPWVFTEQSRIYFSVSTFWGHRWHLHRCVNKQSLSVSIKCRLWHRSGFKKKCKAGQDEWVGVPKVWIQGLNGVHEHRSHVMLGIYISLVVSPK